MTTSVIDLGDVSYSPGEPEVYPDGSREFDRARLGRLAKVAVAVLAALVLGGSGLPGPPVLHEVWSMPYSQVESMVIDEGRLLVRRNEGGETDLTAYDLATGATHWTLDTGESQNWMGFTLQAGVLLLPGDEKTIEITTDDGGMMGYSYAGSTTALDPATGRPLWERPGSPFGEPATDTLLMFERSDAGPLTWIRLVRVRDGSTVWERRAPEKSDTVVVQMDGEVPARVVTASPEGDLTVLRYDDGTQVFAGSVPWRPMSYNTGAGTNLSSAAGRLVVTDTGLDVNTDRSRVTVYRTDDLTPLWSRDAAGWANVQDCGPLVCLGVMQEGLEAVDPQTGERRWAIDGAQFAGEVAGGERLLITGSDDRPRQTLVDAATGRAIGPGSSGGVLYQDAGRGTATLLRDLDVSRSAVNRIDTTTGRSITLGGMGGGVRQFCIGEQGWIVCTTDDRLVVTAVG
ncbi:PQQ-binding-like beta-propeller repeat protein [Actinoplanes sp. NPDC026670]|uniref:outer membrane protein assembly factor BamB family protein n=1 Tax=Actinoplanes sp. NPDC026670 TaxID=3154700 RepID=UPI0033C4F2B7